MRAVLLTAALAGCGFQHGMLSSADAGGGDDVILDDGAADVMADAAAARFCPTGDAHLRLCFSFDQPTLPATLPNEGAANVSAQLTNVTRIARGGAGGAAQLDTTSEIFVPYTADVANIQAIEIWYRYDSEPTVSGGRMGLVDSNVVPANISLFFYRQDPSHTLRCGIGNETIVWDAPLLATNTWLQLICTCDAGSLKMYVDGTKVGDTPGDCAGGGAFVNPDGFTIGSNNNGGATGVTDQLLGAIDGIRLWDQAITP